MPAAADDRFRTLVNRLIYTRRGQIVCSVLFGFAFVLMFRKVCDGKNCKVILAPPLEHIQKTIFELEGDCYRYKPVPIQCPTATTTQIVPSDPNDEETISHTEKTLVSIATSAAASTAASTLISAAASV